MMVRQTHHVRMFTIAAKEFMDYFFSPLAYIFITVFVGLSFWFFFSDFFVRGQASLRLFFNWAPILFLVFLPAVTMGKWSEEIHSGTIEILLTLPVTDWEVVLGKFVSSLLFLAVTLLFTLPLVATVTTLGNPDWGPIIGGYLGLLFLGGASLAIGLFISSTTSSSIVAFIISFLSFFVLLIIGEPVMLNHLPDFLVPLLSQMSLSRHFESMARGVLDTTDVIFYASTTFFFLYLNILSLQNRKRG